MHADLAGKTIIVTGASGGIGRGVALHLGESGCNVVVADITDGGDETAQMINDAGAKAIFVRTNVTDEAQVDAMVEAAVSTYGGLDGAFNNAGIEGEVFNTATCTTENWNNVININLNGVFFCMRAEARYMLENGGGSIINTSSIAGLTGGPDMPAYIASKHGVIGITKAGAIDFAQQGIRVNALCPGSVMTPMVQRLIDDLPEDMDKSVRDLLIGIEPTPMKRLGEPREMATVVAWLLSDDSSFVTGAEIKADGGWTANA